MSSSDEVLWMVDVSIVLSSIGTQASQVGSFRQILARILRSDGSEVPSSHGSSTFDICNEFSASGNEIPTNKKVGKTK